jgi:hypothetical protein
MRVRLLLSAAVPAALLLSVVAPAPAVAAVTVTVSRADLSGSNLRIEGTAFANRDIFVDGVPMGHSDASGRYRIDATGYTAPFDCTIDVDDRNGPRTVSLGGCTVRTPPPAPAGGPVAPTPLSPAAGASVTSPVTMTWSSVLDPSSLNGGYNWQISTSSTFSTLTTRNSTNPATTSAVVGGLLPGTYFWQVQAVTGNLDLSPYSAPRSFVVTGSTGLAAPVLAPLPFGTAYHPMESFPFSWSSVPGAATYTVEASRDATFPAPVELRNDNIPGTSFGLTMSDGLIGDWFLRVRAVSATGVEGPVSNVRTFTISYTAPVGPAPTLISPINGEVLPLPIRLDWNDVPNPQDLGYELQVSSSSTFTTLDVQGPMTNSQYDLLGLSAGPKFWRVRAFKGDSSPTTAAGTAFSAVGRFTVSTAAPKIASVTFTRPTAFSGEFVQGELQLTGPATSAGVITLTSTVPSATPLQTSVPIAAGSAFAQFPMTTGQVLTPTTSTVTASYGGASATTPFTVDPPSLKEISPVPNRITGGAPGGMTLAFNGAVPAGTTVQLGSSSPLATVPASVTVPAGTFFQPVAIQTAAVTSATDVTLTASWKGVQISHVLTLTPAVPPTEWTIDRTQTTGSEGAFARVAIAAAQSTDLTFTLTSSNTSVATMNTSVLIPAGSLQAGVLITTTPPSAPSTVQLTVSGGGVAKSVSLLVNPFPTAPLSAPSLLAPAASARFAPGAPITFDWGDVTGAASYTLQVSASSAFTATLIDRTVPASQLSVSLPTTGDRFWRVRANRADGSGGTWSAARAIRVK